MIQKEYICNVIKALELTFSPKNKFTTRKERIAWMESLLTKSQIGSYEMPSCFDMKYQRIILSAIKHNNISCMYLLLKLKTRIEMDLKGIINKLRKK